MISGYIFERWCTPSLLIAGTLSGNGDVDTQAPTAPTMDVPAAEHSDHRRRCGHRRHVRLRAYGGAADEHHGNYAGLHTACNGESSALIILRVPSR